MSDAIDCGIDCLEHCYFATDEHIERMLQKNTHVCLTMSEYFTDKQYMPTIMAEKFKRYREAVYLVEHGASNLDAVRALTVDGAKLLGVLDTTGSIAKGKAADLVVLDGDPMRDVSAIGRVKAVYQDGKRFHG